jgi:hypothetical protein
MLAAAASALNFLRADAPAPRVWYCEVATPLVLAKAGRGRRGASSGERGASSGESRRERRLGERRLGEGGRGRRQQQRGSRRRRGRRWRRMVG